MKKYNKQALIERAIKTHGGIYDYSLVEDIGLYKKVKIICSKHGNFEQTLNSHINNKQGCPKCGVENIKKSITTPIKGCSLADKFPEIAKELSSKNKKTAYEYNPGAAAKVIWECNKCKYEWEATINNRTKNKGNGCPSCSGFIVTDKNRLSIIRPDIASEWDYKKNYPLTPHDVFKGSVKKYYWLCANCNNSFKSTCHTRYNGSGCPKCRQSVGEKIIEYLLNKESIYFQSEYIDKECKSTYPLRFDFAVWINGKLGLIEYNGIQHYEITKFSPTETELEKQKTRDKLKIDFCNKNNIPLLVVSYKDQGVLEDLIKTFLESLANA